MTPYERVLLEKQKMCCINCKYLHQEPRQNTVEGTDHINYCKKSGKIILEMHIGTNVRNCFERERIRMNKAFEEILERLDELIEKSYYAATEGNRNAAIKNRAYHKVKKIVQEVAEEYNNGWIPCSERLPCDDSICIVTVEYTNNETVVDYGWFDRIGVCWYVGMQEFRTSNIISWQPLPLPYKERD